MPPDYDNSTGSMEAGNSASSLTSSIQHSPETASLGWDSIAKVDESAEERDFSSWGVVDMPEDRVAAKKKDMSQNFDVKPITFSNRSANRYRSQDDVRMLEDEDRKWVQDSKSSDCLTKRKRSLDLSQNQGESEVNTSKRVHADPAW